MRCLYGSLPKWYKWNPNGETFLRPSVRLSVTLDYFSYYKSYRHAISASFREDPRISYDIARDTNEWVFSRNKTSWLKIHVRFAI